MLGDQYALVRAQSGIHALSTSSSYLDEIKARYKKQPSVYSSFINLIGDYNTGQLVGGINFGTLGDNFSA